MAQKKAPRLARDFVFETKLRNHSTPVKSIDFKIKIYTILLPFSIIALATSALFYIVTVSFRSILRKMRNVFENLFNS